MSDPVFDTFYRSIFADLTIDKEESETIMTKFRTANPPPDKLLTLRAAAFRVGTEFLTMDKDKNISLLRAISAVVHTIETTCMSPKPPPKSSPNQETIPFDEGRVEALYRKIFADMLVDRDEIKELTALYKESFPPKDKLRWTRSSAFRIASEFVSTDDKAANVALLRCINSIVHSFETNCLTPKPYKLETKRFDMKSTISQATQHLWDIDVNRATAGRDYTISVQNGKKPYQKQDVAAEPLFTRVDPALFRRPTYRAFIALLDNYVAQTGVSESVSGEERVENRTFIDAVMQTGPMQFCHAYCRANGKHRGDVPADVAGFKKLLHKIWFELYFRERGGRPDSSGFEHVFVGEIRDGKVSGFHNWMRFYFEERKGNVDYKGYIKPRGRNNAETNGDDNILTLQFTWNGYEKFVGTNFVGVSPEFELALFTMCFLVGEDVNFVELNTGTDYFELEVKVHTMARDKIGTSYVEALGHYE